MIIKSFRALVFLLLLCATFNINARENTTGTSVPQTAFERGTQAYRAGDYQAALAFFNSAWAAGNNSATLVYNRGVTLYKLGRLDEAKQVFTGLLLDTQWVDVARYNLGRIAEDQRDYTSAYDWYRNVAQQAANEKLRGLAQQKLAGLDKPIARPVEPAQPAKDADKGAALLSVGLAADNNAMSLADELGQNSSDAADMYRNLLAYGHYYVDGEKDSGIKLYGLAYDRRFQTFDVFDATILGLGGVKEMTFQHWRAEIGVRITRAWVYDGYLANQYSLVTQWQRPLPVGRAKLNYHSTYYDAADNFSHLAGWQHQFQLGWQHSRGNFTFEPALRLQTNQRENKQSATQFYSYSPTSIGLLMDLKWKLSNEWSLYSDLELSRASYSGENRLTDIGGIDREQKRENTRVHASLGVKYQFAKRWSAKADYAVTNVADEYDIYSYAKQVVGVKLEWFY